jgi:hydrophobic/amphiphilic exporter-1 (mainly G- bacteria), HAE1 family
MQFTRLAITRKWATTAVFLALCAIGTVSYLQLPLNQFPNVPIPIVTVLTVYPGANPEEIETQITRPIEDAVAGLSGVSEIRSTSGQSVSTVIVIFEDSADLTQVASDVERQLSGVVGEFPTGAERPIVRKIDLGQEPVMQLALVDASIKPEELYRLAKDEVSPSLEALEGVSQVSLIGGRPEEIRIEIDPRRLAGFGVSLAQVQGAVAAANASLPGGSIRGEARQFDLQVSGLVAKPEDLGEIVVGGAPGLPVRVRDVATVVRGASEETSATRVNGEQAILIALAQSTGTDLTKVTDGVTANLEAIRAKLPPTSELLVVFDLTPFVEASLLGIQEELLIAIVLTSVILLLFMHNLRAATIVLLSIPTTLLTTFFLMQMMGFTLNFLSMLGLTLTIGILVDDSIVVLENILRHRDRGGPPAEAALLGRSEIGLAAIAITFVDVVIFVPTGLVSGQIGGFFREFGFTVAAATLMSLVVSFALTPMLAARFLSARTPDEDASRGGPLQRFGVAWDREFERLERAYGRVLGWSLRHGFIVAMLALASLVGGVMLVVGGAVTTEFVPQADDGFVFVRTETPPGTSLQTHLEVLDRIEAVVRQVPEVETVTSSVGVSQQGFFAGVGSSGARFGAVTMGLVHKDERSRDVFQIVEEMRNLLAAVPGADIRVNTQPSNVQPVQVRITGPSLATVGSLAAEMQAAIERIDGVTSVSNGSPVGQPQLLVRVDQRRAADLGVSAAAVGLTVRTAFAGVVATKFQEPDGTQQDVRLLLKDTSRTDAAQLGDLPVQSQTGQLVLLRQVATISEAVGPAQIERFERERVVSIGADLRGATLGEVLPRVQAAMDAMVVPPGYDISLGGEGQDQNEAFTQLFLALGAGVLLAYLLMAVLYNSLTDPLVILFSLPVSVAGAMLGLWVFQYTFNVFSMIGLILLVGLAIKNGILLIDRTKKNREQGMTVADALLEAGPARLRPILMTSVTIALALLPIALQLGEGAELRAPLAATVLGGVISSTLLTLVLIPVVYNTFAALPDAIVRWLRFTGILAMPAPARVSEAGDD